MNNTQKVLLGFFIALLLNACGGGGEESNNQAPENGSALFLNFQQVKMFSFTWSDVEDATFYRLSEDPDGISGFTQISNDIPQGTEKFDIEVPLFKRTNAVYLLESCNSVDCTSSSESIISIGSNLAEGVGYFKAGNNNDTSNGTQNRSFGAAIAISEDGSTMAVGAPSFGGILPAGQGDAPPDSGGVYIFAKSDNDLGWVQQEFLVASNANPDDRFGTSVALSADGNTLAVGATGEDSNANGVGGDQSDNNAESSGAAYVFKRDGTEWVQEEYLKPTLAPGALFGTSIDISDDGNTISVGAPGNSSITGSVVRFERDENIWRDQGALFAGSGLIGNLFGKAHALSGDGNTLVASTSKSLNFETGEVSDTDLIYVSTDEAFSGILGSNTEEGDNFGHAVAINSDGTTIAVTARFEGSSATGIDGDETDNTSRNSGALYIFDKDENNSFIWNQAAYIKASNSQAEDFFGTSVAISDDGNTVVVGAESEDGGSNGLSFDLLNNEISKSGAAYVFTRIDGSFIQTSYLKASNPGRRDNFGESVAISGDAKYYRCRNKPRRE